MSRGWCHDSLRLGRERSPQPGLVLPTSRAAAGAPCYPPTPGSIASSRTLCKGFSGTTGPRSWGCSNGRPRGQAERSRPAALLLPGGREGAPGSCRLVLGRHTSGARHDAGCPREGLAAGGAKAKGRPGAWTAGKSWSCGKVGGEGAWGRVGFGFGRGWCRSLCPGLGKRFGWQRKPVRTVSKASRLLGSLNLNFNPPLPRSLAALAPAVTDPQWLQAGAVLLPTHAGQRGRRNEAAWRWPVSPPRVAEAAGGGCKTSPGVFHWHLFTLIRMFVTVGETLPLAPRESGRRGMSVPLKNPA